MTTNIQGEMMKKGVLEWEENAIDAVFATSNIDWNDKKCLMGNDTGCPPRRAGAEGGLTTNKNN